MAQEAQRSDESASPHSDAARFSIDPPASMARGPAAFAAAMSSTVTPVSVEGVGPVQGQTQSHHQFSHTIGARATVAQQQQQQQQPNFFTSPVSPNILADPSESPPVSFSYGAAQQHQPPQQPQIPSQFASTTHNPFAPPSQNAHGFPPVAPHGYYPNAHHAGNSSDVYFSQHSSAADPAALSSRGSSSSTFDSGIAMRSRQQAPTSSAAFAYPSDSQHQQHEHDEESHHAFLDGDGDGKSKGGANKQASWAQRGRLQLHLLYTRLRSMTPMQALKLFGALLFIVLLLRFVLHRYEDRGKSSSFTIVSLLRDMSPAARELDPVGYAFQYAALASWGQLVVGGNILVFADDAAQCASIAAVGPRGLQCIPVPCFHTELHKPLLDCIFRSIHLRAPTDVVAYTNAHVALYTDLADAVESVAMQKDKFIMGQAGRDNAKLFGGIESPSIG